MNQSQNAYDLILYHWKGEDDILTGRHTEWLTGETITSVTAVSSDPNKVQVTSPGTINTENATVLGILTPPGEASFVLYRVIGGKKGNTVVVTVTIETTDVNRTDIIKALIHILG